FRDDRFSLPKVMGADRLPDMFGIVGRPKRGDLNLELKPLGSKRGCHPDGGIRDEVVDEPARWVGESGPAPGPVRIGPPSTKVGQQQHPDKKGVTGTNGSYFPSRAQRFIRSMFE